MGVDIQTYRARIGTYSNSYSRDGDAVTFAKQVNIRDGVETVGCLIFIGILLVMAGIELNPGPREKEWSKILEPINIPNVKISGLNKHISKEMLEMFFELEEQYGGGKIETFDIDSNNKCATLTFREKADFDAFMNRKPRSILGSEVTIEIIDTTHNNTNIKSRRIKISGLKGNVNKEVLKLFFEKEQTVGGGKVKCIDIDNKNECAFIEFEEKSGVQWIMKKTPLSIFGMKVHTEIVETHIGEHKMIKITKLPAFINIEMLKWFFEHKTDCSENIVELTVNSEENYAIVEFDESEAVCEVMNRRPLKIFDFELDVDIFDTSLVVEPQHIPRIRISGLKENTNKVMLALYFEHEERKGGGKVKKIEMSEKGKFATIDFEEKAAADAFMLRNPKYILGMDVTLEVIDTSLVVEPQHIPRIRISGLKENTNKEMLALYFEHEERKGGGKVKKIEMSEKGKFATIDFEEKAAADAFMLRNPKSILGMDVTLEVIDTTYDMSRTKSTRIKITGLAENINKEILEMFFKTEERKGGGKVNNIFIDGKNKCALIEFKNERGVEWIISKTPMLLFGMEVGIETLDDEPKKIQITNLPAIISNEMLKMFFETKTKFGGKIISIISEWNKAIVEFDDSIAVYRIMEERPLTILGFDVDVDVVGDKDDSGFIIMHHNCVVRAETEPDFSHKNEHSDESQKTKTIQITKLPDHVNREMLIKFFESKTNYFGKVVNVIFNSESEEHYAIVEFDEYSAVYKAMDRRPLTMYGSEVDIYVDIKGLRLKDNDSIDKWRFWKWKWKKIFNVFDKPETCDPSIHKYKNELEKNGLTGLKALLSKDLGTLTNTEIHIAVIGTSGTGKSSFINSIRGLKPEDPGAATVGVTETTSTCNRYEHPENKSFVVWDLPGVGTSSFPQKNYLQKVGCDQYDFFIIISKDRCTELDLWLAQEIRYRNKSCFFVRSNIDITIKSNAKDYRKTHNEETLLQSITTKIKEEFQKNGLDDQKVFLISNRALDKYDFGRLNNELLSSSDGLKKDSLALSLSAVTREVIDEKKRVLKRRIDTTALSIATTSTESEQKVLFQQEIHFYRKQFNIDEKTLSENKAILFLTDDNLEDFRVEFDKYQQDRRMTMKTPTASRNEASALQRFADWFTFSKKKSLLYGYSKMALENNLELLYQRSKTLYDTSKVITLVKNVSN